MLQFLTQDQKETCAKTDLETQPSADEIPTADKDKSFANKDNKSSPIVENQQVLGDKKPANNNMTVEVKRCNICRVLKTDQKFTKPHMCDPTLLAPTTATD